MVCHVPFIERSTCQIVMYSVLGYFFLTVLPVWLGGTATVLDVLMWEIAKSVLIFLGIPLALSALTRIIGVNLKGRDWYDNVLMPKLGPTALIGLLYTIVLMFSMQGEKIVSLPMDVLRISLPIMAYFLIMFFLAFAVSKALDFNYQETAALSFTAAGNNFQLAIAVAVGSSASPRRRPSPPSSAPSSRCLFSWPSSTSRCGSSGAGSLTSPKGPFPSRTARPALGSSRTRMKAKIGSASSMAR